MGQKLTITDADIAKAYAAYCRRWNRPLQMNPARHLVESRYTDEGVSIYAAESVPDALHIMDIGPYKTPVKGVEIRDAANLALGIRRHVRDAQGLPPGGSIEELFAFMRYIAREAENVAEEPLTPPDYMTVQTHGAPFAYVVLSREGVLSLGAEACLSVQKALKGLQPPALGFECVVSEDGLLLKSACLEGWVYEFAQVDPLGMSIYERLCYDPTKPEPVSVYSFRASAPIPYIVRGEV